MMRLLKYWFAALHGWFNRRLIQLVDHRETHEIVRIVTRSVGLTWVDMDNHVVVRNKYFLPYRLEEVRLTYYNDAMQNVGYLHFRGPLRMGPFATRKVIMPSKMSNITALFNGVRMLLSDHVKTRTVGTTTIRLLGMRFELPVDDIMVIDRSKIVTAEVDEAEKLRREEARQNRRLKREEAKAAREARRQERRAERERQNEARRLRYASKSGKPARKNPVSPASETTQPEACNPATSEGVSAAPGPDRTSQDW